MTTDGLDARGRPRVQTVNDGPSRVIESDAGDADIKTIMTRHGVTGVVEHLNQAELVYGDVSEVTDFAQAMRVVKDADNAFMKLPSKVREVFQHDAAVWLDAANDGLSVSQQDELVKLGYLEAPDAPVSEEAPVEPVPEAAPSG